MPFNSPNDTQPGGVGCIRTFTGRLVDPFNLHPDDIIIEDIAHALSNLCRFTGHTRGFYSVAMHCLGVSDMLKGPKLKMAGLLHDAGEAYFGDMAGPTKCRPEMQVYRDAEHKAERQIMDRYNIRLTHFEHTQLKQADKDAYYLERNCLMRPDQDGIYEKGKLPVVAPLDAEDMYLSAFSNLVSLLASQSSRSVSTNFHWLQ